VEGGVVQLLPSLAPVDREAVLHAVVSGGGAMLLAYAWFAWLTDRATPLQLRGLVAAGVGFLMSAGASIYLRDHTVAGPTLSLVGCALVLVGMRTLVRERLERQEAARRRAARGGAGK
jgi:hypothetical protein